MKGLFFHCCVGQSYHFSSMHTTCIMADVAHYEQVMEVSRPDFMGLGLVSQRSWSRLEVQRSRSRSRPQDLKEEKN